jgi:ketosteroid isomerase-like protein
VTDPTAIVRAYFEAITAHDVEAVQSCFADDGELVTATGTYQGPGAIGGFYRDNAFQLADLRPTPGAFVVDGNSVAVEIDLLMGGQHTAVADFFTIHDDKIRRLVIYLAGPPLS